MDDESNYNVSHRPDDQFSTSVRNEKSSNSLFSNDKRSKLEDHYQVFDSEET